MTDQEQQTLDHLRGHMRRHSGQLLTPGTFASEEFDRAYLAWIQARWDAGDEWTRSVWTTRPEAA